MCAASRQATQRQVFRVVSFVASQVTRFFCGRRANTQQCCFSFRRATGLSQQRIHHQAVPILHQYVLCVKRKPCFTPLVFLNSRRSVLSGRFMFLSERVSAHESSSPSDCPSSGFVVVAAGADFNLGWKLFKLAQPRDHRSVNREMFVRQQLFGARCPSTAAKNSSAISPRARSRFC